MSARNRLPDDLLDRPLAEAARRIALGELERASRARAALAAGEDPEALHDLRVALRRLRSQLRAWRGELGGPIGGKPRRRLRDLAASTNPGRDAEVGAALARGLAVEARSSAPASSRTAAEARAAEVLAARLERKRDAVYAELGRVGLGRFDALHDRLYERLGTWEIRIDAVATGAPTLRAALADEIRGHALALAEALAHAAAGDGGDAAAHRARIEAKRLRYLIEPVAGALAAAREPLAALRTLQDLLGDANDLAVLAGELAADAAEAERARLATAAGTLTPAARGDGGRTGRAALARRIAARRADLRRRFESGWAGDGARAAHLADALEVLLATLVAD